MEEKDKMNDQSGLNKETFGTVGFGLPNEGNTEETAEEKKVYIPGYDSTEASANPQINYYTGTVIQEPKKKQSRALEICALVFGILGIVGCCCYGVFGIIGLVLSIVALATDRKSGLSIAGLVCSVIGLLATCCVVAFSFSDVGREFWKSYKTAYEAAYEEASGRTLDDDDQSASEYRDEDVFGDDSEETKTVNKGAAKNEEISSKEAGAVVIYGQSFTVPCKMEEVEKVFEVEAEDKQASMEAYDSVMCDLIFNGEEIPVTVFAMNTTDGTIQGMGEAVVSSFEISAYDDGNVDAEVFGGIKAGMSEEDLKSVLSEYEYTYFGDEEYAGYSLMLGDMDKIYITAMVESGKVSYISVSGYGDPE